MKNFSAVALAMSCLMLVACGESGTGGSEDDTHGGVTQGQPDWDSYEESKVEAEALESVANISSQPWNTRVDTTPTQDTASMRGVFSFDTGAVEAATGVNRSIVGEMTMEADFGAGTVSGQLHNTFVDYGSEHDPLSGSLSYQGDVEIAAGETDLTTRNDENPINTDINANGGASLTSGDGTTYNVLLDVFGDVHEIPVVGDGQIVAVDGLLEGNVTLTDADGITDPTVYDLDGAYFVHEDE